MNPLLWTPTEGQDVTRSLFPLSPKPRSSKPISKRRPRMLTLILILAVVALVFCLWHAFTGKVPIWGAVLCLCLIEILRVLPVGK